MLHGAARRLNFQQDGTPLHYYNPVRIFLKRTFPPTGLKVVDQVLLLERSLDLTFAISFAWSYDIKDIFFNGSFNGRASRSVQAETCQISLDSLTSVSDNTKL